MSRFLTLFFASSCIILAQGLNDAALSGGYNFVALRVDVDAAGIASNGRNIGGVMMFDGAGGFSFQGQLGSGFGAASATSGNGSYSLGSNGFLTVTNPIDSGLTLDARYGENGDVLLGSSVGDLQGRDIWVAVRQSTSASAATLTGSYAASFLRFPGGGDEGVVTALAFLEANGAGGFTSFTLDGHSAAQDDVPMTESITAASYTLGPDGSGTMQLGAQSTLLNGALNVFVDPSGSIVLGYSPEAGARDVLLGVRSPEGAASNASFNGTYWMVELLADSQARSYTGAVGALRANDDPVAQLAQRISVSGADVPFEFSVVQAYGVSSDGTGFLRGFPEPDVVNLALAGTAADAGAFVAAEVSQVDPFYDFHGISFGVRVPSFSGEGVFVEPLGVLNAASFAPPTAPIAPGALVSIFGSNLSAETAGAQGVPLPTQLAGVSVTVNGTPAPLFFVSENQINLQTPFGAAGTEASIVVTNNGAASNTVGVPVSASSPGIFSLTQAGFGPGIITDANFDLISEQNPATAGQVVIIFLTGLGATNPSFGDGAAGPSDALARTPIPIVQFGGEAGDVSFAGAAPNFVGLYQINVSIPETTFLGAGVPVTIITGNAINDTVDIAIGF